jgi:hypothetical protein
MALRYIVDDIIQMVRSQLDETNTETIDDERDILPALNRAQDVAANLLAHHYETPLLKYVAVTLNTATAEYDIPEDALEQRLERVEVRGLNSQGSIASAYFPVERIDYRELANVESQVRASIPLYYCVIGTKYRLVPVPTAVFPLRIWYMRDPDPLVKSQGRINLVNSANNYVILDQAGSQLTTALEDLDSYVNLVDGQSGVVKGTLQVQSIAGNKVTFKSVPSRTTVLNRTIASSIPAEVAVDDYICLIHGSCVPFMKKPLTNFLVQYAVAELTRKLGGEAGLEKAVLADLQKAVETSWVGQEASLRVTKTNRFWERPRRRIIPSST